jgi:hypothetical protein
MGLNINDFTQRHNKTLNSLVFSCLSSGVNWPTREPGAAFEHIRCLEGSYGRGSWDCASNQLHLRIKLIVISVHRTV